MMEIDTKEWTLTNVRARSPREPQSATCGFCELETIGPTKIIEAVRPGVILTVLSCMNCFDKYFPDYQPAAPAAVAA